MPVNVRRDGSARRRRAAVVVRLFLLCSLLVGEGCASPMQATGSYMDVSGWIENAAGIETIVTFNVFLDGHSITYIPVTAAPRSRAAIIGAINPGTLGSHMLEIKMLDQVGSPNEYRVYDLTVRSYDHATLTSAHLVGTATLPPITQSLTTGQSIVCRFSL